MPVEQHRIIGHEGYLASLKRLADQNLLDKKVACAAIRCIEPRYLEPSLQFVLQHVEMDVEVLQAALDCIMYASGMSASKKLELVQSMRTKMNEYGIPDTRDSVLAVAMAMAGARQPDQLMEHLTAVVEAGYKAHVDVSTLNRVLTRLAKYPQDLATMVKVFRLLTDKAGVWPNYKTFDTLIAAYARTGSYKDIAALMTEMRRRFGIQPNVRNFGNLAQAFDIGDAPQKALKLLPILEQADVRPNTQFFNRVLATCAKRGWVEEAQEVWKELLLRRVSRCALH